MWQIIVEYIKLDEFTVVVLKGISCSAIRKKGGFCIILRHKV